ncbi:sulfate ABC transporter permease subunit CysT [Patulibacter americanus]|uniref:sulfate ABC transporter permease subunit CysT n=1 Tax=Patulibacter americanus TaxID=588672 RepID=UPI0003B7311D|nr:sulfate ABC transporter permease subunit CysT [Patulibacter americanus]
MPRPATDAVGGAGGPGPSLPPSAPVARRRSRRAVGGVGPLGLGVATLWLSLIVLLPLAAVLVSSLEGGLAGFWDAVSSPPAQRALKLTLTVSAVVTVINAVMGTLIAWVLVRDEFRGKAIVNALIDLPFALPTIVASIVLLALIGANSPIGLDLVATHWAIGIALLFVTLPFVVRSVQPVMLELDRDAEQAAASLGASNATIFRRIVLPALAPALISGAGLAFARAVGEYGSVVLVSGNTPRNQVASQYIADRIETDQPAAAAAMSVTLLLITFAVLLVLRVVAHRRTSREG